MIQRGCTDTPDQTFRIEAASDGETFTLRPLHNPTACLDVAERAPSDGDGGALLLARLPDSGVTRPLRGLLTRR